MEAAGGKRPRLRTFLRWLWRVGLAVVAMLALATGLAILNNNYSFTQPSRAEFMSSLDRSLEMSADWARGQYSPDDVRQWVTDDGRGFMVNSALAHMLVDCASMSPDPRLKQLAAFYAEAHRTNPVLWAKLVNPSIVTSPFTERELEGQEMYQRWILKGISPSDVHLSDVDMEDMFSPDKFRTGKATHQLFSLYVYRQFNGDTPALQNVMNHVEERIASEAALDFRVTDLYLQRISFLLAAGRPDLVKPRWVERALAAQQPNGGWMYAWHGWSPKPYHYTFDYDHPQAHPTAQGMWMACMLKYRYPEWIDQHFK